MTPAATERHALITGAGSPIARSLAEQLARAGWHLTLAGRDADDLSRVASDLKIRFGIAAHVARFDATADSASHAALFEECVRRCGDGLQLLVICHGTIVDLPADADASTRANAANQMMAVNFTGAVMLLERAAAYFERGGKGTIIGVSSVAADRPRKSIYAYGLSKAALSFHLEGLRHRLAKTPVRVLTVKPGFVDTRLTWGRPGMFLVASPERVARATYRAIVSRRGDTIYTPWFWRWIMLIIRLIPDPIFRRLNL
jgi:decaprenylphospho-beta-D-erythro-pentofuranosid-2-ulose 2-reductase